MNKLILLFLSLILISSVNAQVDIIVAFPHLSFTNPVDLQAPADGSNRIFVVEQAGLIHVFKNDTMTAQTNIFLDISSLVDDSGTEMGLLGLAFHPNYAENGYFYVNYTAANPRHSVIERFSVSGNDPEKADPESGLILLEYDQPESNHNGGQIAFGPDGYLYIAAGDGGGGGDDHGEIGNGQDLTQLLGKILRIDVDNSSQERNYAIPEDNPFAGNQNGYREEIYAYGLRNPWRFSFDTDTGWLWAADVGQGRYEEIDIIENGKNYGWRIMEGFHCYNPSTGCNTEGLELPIWEYDHNTGNSITGGYVYHGQNVPELQNKFIYGDYLSHRIWALTYDGVNPVENEDLGVIPFDLVSFGTDENEELYMLTFDGSNAKIYTFKTGTTSTLSPHETVNPLEYTLGDNFPDPFNPETNIPVTIQKEGNIEIAIYSITGRLVKTIQYGSRNAGRYFIQWDGTDQKGMLQPSGIYLYQLKFKGNLVDTKQMVFLK